MELKYGETEEIWEEIDNSVMWEYKNLSPLKNEEGREIYLAIIEEVLYLVKFDSNKRTKLLELHGKLGHEKCEHFQLVISGDQKMVAIADAIRTRGLVFHLVQREIIFEFGREDYYAYRSPFPVAWITKKIDPNTQLLLFGVTWNRLNLFDPITQKSHLPAAGISCIP